MCVCVCVLAFVVQLKPDSGMILHLFVVGDQDRCHVCSDCVPYSVNVLIISPVSIYYGELLCSVLTAALLILNCGLIAYDSLSLSRELFPPPA